MARDRVTEKWLLSTASSENDVEEEEEEEEEALSLCDLPINRDNQSRIEAPEASSSTIKVKIQDEFDFCSLFKESEMCSADEVFFQGQILPLRHSVSGSLAAARSNSRCFSRSESVEHGHHYPSNGLSTSGSSSSSRSSSIRSHQSSSSSGSGSGGSSTHNTIDKSRRVKRNQFHSHPSPKPQIKYPNIKNQKAGNFPQKSTMWSLFRLGLVTTPEIALEDLRVRSINNCNKSYQESKSFGSRNSTNSSSNSISSANSKKKKQSLFDINGALFSGCKCSTDVVDTVPPRVIGAMRRSVSTNDASYSHEEQMKERTKQQQQQQQQEEGKQEVSRHRTFEWLKQLPLESTTSAIDA